MPYTTHRGHKIHFTQHGQGPVVVLQHGFLSSAANWLETGYVEPLARHYRVVCIDSLGHGLSDKPTNLDSYRQDQRAGDIIAVLDAVGAAQAHVLGYSMGGWIAAGVAQHFPQRLASLTIAGWDFQNGMQTAFKPLGIDGIEFKDFIAMAKTSAPQLTQWISEPVMAALEPCFHQLAHLEGNAQAVAALTCPLMLWNGIEDPYHQTMAQYAEEHDHTYLATPGDHLGAMINSAPMVTAKLDEFIRRHSS